LSTLLDDERPLLLIGAGGQLGGEFVKQLRRHRGRVVATTSERGGPLIHTQRQARHANKDTSWRRVDVSNTEALAKLIDDLQPRVVINASAYTAVDQAETNHVTANAINAIAPQVMAETCAAHGAVLVHFSTDYVFDGRSKDPYTEQDLAQPLNEYGRSKLCGERAVLDLDAGHFVFRTSWLYTPGGHNFVTTMVRVLRGESPVRVVNDQHGCPTWARDVAAVVSKWLVQTPTVELKRTAGLYHLCCAGHCSWHEFAVAIRERMSPPAIADLVAIDTATFGAVTIRPQRSVLDCTRARDILNLRLPVWHEAIDAAMPAFNDAAQVAH
jgi:dTDP-4-dehydrorhamnose reductase